MQVFLLRKTSQVPRERSPFRWCIMFAELFCAGMRFARPSFNYLPLGSAHSQEHRFIKSLKSCVSVCMSRGCIIYLWSSTWAGRCRTPWLTWGCRTPAMKPSTRSDGAETQPLIHTHFLYFDMKISTAGFNVPVFRSWAWTWRSWRRWRRMPVWGTEASAGWQVKKSKDLLWVMRYTHLSITTQPHCYCNTMQAVVHETPLCLCWTFEGNDCVND